MKNYLSFNLTGKKLFPIWILFLLLFIAPYLFVGISLTGLQHTSIAFTYLLIPYLIIVAFVFTFFFAKLVIEGLSYNNNNVVFTGTFLKYSGVFLLGLFLSIITLGIYMAWFMKDMYKFFINNSSLDSHNMQFNGKGGKLFVILLLTMFIPIILFSLLFARFILAGSSQASSSILIVQVIMVVFMIPYFYLYYKWMVNLTYKDYTISWSTSFWPSCGKIAIEMFLSIITIGIYMPLAMLRLYKYFSEKTVAKTAEKTLKLGFDIDQLNDFLFIWGQTLLGIVTLGIYFPWAYCKIGSRILGKTYLEQDAVA
jgi:hypothetical protein